MFVFGIFIFGISCKNITGSSTNNNTTIAPIDSGKISYWITTGDQQLLLKKQSPNLIFGQGTSSKNIIEINDQNTFQTMDGFGFMLTGASAQLINNLEASSKSKLLQELFGNGTNDISISYLRISIGASDLSTAVYSYDDIPEGQTDINLENFDLKPDKKDLIPLLKEILKINPKIKIMGTPWSPPLWMKNNGSSIGGELKAKYYEVYAQYLVKYLQKMKEEGFDIETITPQNEPMNSKNNPSMVMTAEQQTNFIKNYLGPAFKKANITTKIITYDHNCDRPDYPITVLGDSEAAQYVVGSAFHLYGGDISALSNVHDSFPLKNIYFTEQYTSAKGGFAGDLKWHLKNVVIGSLRNWSRTVLEWNLANDPQYQMHTPGGCDECKGAITINGNDISRNVSYYIIAHIAKFVPPGSQRIESNMVGNLKNVAFKTPNGSIGLLVENDGNEALDFSIKYGNRYINTTLKEGAVSTFIWKKP